jgi:preprotein translocase subunit SecG
MLVAEYILLSLLLVSALFIVIAVTLQKSNDEGLSGTIAGGSDTYYGKENTGRKEKLLGKWMLIVSIIFAIAVVVVYVIQPDYSADSSSINFSQWKDLSEFSAVFK